VILDSQGGLISETTATLEVTELTTSTQGDLEVEDASINALTNLKIALIAPVPIEAGCNVEIFFPVEIELDNNFTDLSLLGGFGAPRQPSF
jgi:hypothetical protein